MPVDQRIQQIVINSVHHLDASYTSLLTSNWIKASRLSRHALQLSKSAFFDPTMSPALYFPDEHLYAVYAPLFLPILVPIVSALIKMIKGKKKNNISSNLIQTSNIETVPIVTAEETKE